MPKKTKFVIPEIPKTFPSREEKEAMTDILRVEYHAASAKAIKAEAVANKLRNHESQVFAAYSATCNTRVSAKKKASA